MRTYTIEFTYDVTLDADDEQVAINKAYQWFQKLQSNPDRELPDDVWSVRTMPKSEVVFVGGEK
jgi:hypothetical protein